MTSYEPVPRSDGAIRGQPVASRGGHIIGNGGVRTQWWWEEGPVDSCCFCCTLRAGVGILAARKVFGVLYVIFVTRAFFAAGVRVMLEDLQQQFLKDCTENDAPTLDCEDLEEAIEETKSLLTRCAVYIFLQNAFCLMAGAAGLWAVSFDSARAAKVFMLWWPASFLVALFDMLQQTGSMRKFDLEPVLVGGFWWWMQAVHIFFLVYYFKVCWSFYKEILRESARVSRNDSLNAVNQEEESMIAMSVTV